jgi:hypothetical protein
MRNTVVWVSMVLSVCLGHVACGEGQNGGGAPDEAGIGATGTVGPGGPDASGQPTFSTVDVGGATGEGQDVTDPTVTTPDGGSATTPDGGVSPGADAVDGPPCVTDTDCPEGQQCLPQQLCAVCYPGTYTCDGDVSMVCDLVGSQWLVNEDCTSLNQTCNVNLGVCESPCGALGKMAGTNAGCEFWAVDLHNGVEAQQCVYLDAQNAPFAVIVSNTSKTVTAQVTLTLPNGQGYPANVLPQTLATFPIPETWSLEGTGRTQSAFHIVSTAPIVAYQFNPLDNVDVFSNDASLLLPVDAMGSDYYVLTRRHDPIGTFSTFPSYFSLVGVSEQPVEITMNVAGNTAAGGEFPALSPGTPHTFTLAKGDVVNIESSSGDLTGSRVTGTGPFALFAGHVASRTHPEPSGCCADHLEQQLPPIDRWGTHFAVGRSVKRRFESDHFRVLASESGTVVTVDGGASPPGFLLEQAQFGDFVVDGHVQITSNKPILVAQFLASSGEAGAVEMPCGTANDCGDGYECSFSCKPLACSTNAECGSGHTCKAGGTFPCESECKAVGDPAMILSVPTNQWQEEFVFLTPDKYVQDFVNIVAASSATVTLDGAPIPWASFEAIPNSSYGVFRTEVGDGVHTVTSTEPAAVTVYGYDASVSYGYPAAMGLKHAVTP